MAKVLMTTTVNAQTGAPINTFSVSSGDIIKAVVLRKKMCAGAYQVREVNLSLTVPDGTQTSFSIPNSNPEPITDINVRPAATMTVQQGAGVEEESWVEGTDFTIDGYTLSVQANLSIYDVLGN